MPKPEGYEPKIRREKVAAVDEIKAELERVSVALLTEYRGLTVPEFGALRGQLREADTAYRVVKNTFARRAATELGIDGLDELLEGPTALAYCYGDPVAGAKALDGFAKSHEALTIKGGVLDGRVMSAEEAKSLARVDALEVSLAKIAGALTGSLQAITMMLESPLRRILYVLEQVAARGGAPEEAPVAAQESAEPESAEPESAEPESAEPESAEPESAEPESAEPESAEPESAEPESAEPATEEPKTNEGA